MSTKTTTNWLKKIFSIGTLSLIVAVIGTYISYKTLLADTGGELNIEYGNSLSSLSDSIDVEFVDDKDAAEQINALLPEFANPSKYMLKDFYLRYNFKGHGFDIIPSGYFDKIEGNKGISLTYRPGRLAAGLKVEEPIAALKTNNNVAIKVEIDASFNGNSEPYHRIYELKLHKGHIARTKSSVIEVPVASTLPSTPSVENTNNKQKEISQSDTRDIVHVNDTPAQAESETKSVKVTTIKKQNDNSTFTGVLIFILLGLFFFCCFPCYDLHDAFESTKDRSLSNLKYLFFRDALWIKDAYPTGGKRVWANFLWYSALVGWSFVVIFFTAVIIILIYAFFGLIL